MESVPRAPLSGTAALPTTAVPGAGLPPARELTLLVYRQMRALTGPHRDLEDLAQTALEQILRSDYRGESKLSTFTHSICYHVWAKHLRFNYRFRARFVPAETEELMSGVETSDPASLLEDRRRFLRLYEAIERISVKRRAVVALHDVSGLSIPEIAGIVSASEATVRSRLRDGRRKLRALLDRDPEFSRKIDADAHPVRNQELSCPQS